MNARVLLLLALLPTFVAAEALILPMQQRAAVIDDVIKTAIFFIDDT